jgi:hypothetical protein
MAPFIPQSWSDLECRDNDPSTDKRAVKLADHLTVTQAENLLDWLEVHGVHPRDVQIEPDGLMTVRWRT